MENKLNPVFEIKLNKEDKEALYLQLAEKITELIEAGELLPNSKLPSIRSLAKALEINNITVINCYKHLERKKILYSKGGSGTFVAKLEVNLIPEPIIKQQNSINKLRTINPLAINFAKSSVSPELFPVEKFKLLFNEVLERDKGNAFSFQDTQGYLPLREALAKSLEKSGIKTSATRIQIVSGAQQGIDIISKAMLSAGDIVFVEKPTYYGAVGAILSRGAGIIEIPMLDDGIDIEGLELMLDFYRPKFIYVMPNYQTPTCVSYSIEKKRQLLEIAYKKNIWIVEEDNLSDFNYSKEPIKTLKSLDYKNKVIYIKSFSKILMPGLRLGFMILPKSISEEVISAKYTTDISTSGFIQRAFELFINSGAWQEHILHMKSYFGKKYQLISREIKKNLSKYTSYIEQNGGLSFCLKLKGKKITAEELCQRLNEKNVILNPFSVYSIEKRTTEQFIRLSFAEASDEEITRGIEIIAEQFKEIYKK